jgi:MFS family permease
MPTRSGAALGAQQSAAGLARVVGPLLGGALFAVATPIPYVVSALLTLAALVLVPNLAGPTSNPRVPG